MSQHTKGPWTLMPCSHGGMLLRRGDQVGANMHIQSSLQILPKSDAHLIAAAPDYDKAAREMLERHDAKAERRNGQRCGCTDCELFRPIVAKAEGRMEPTVSPER